MTYIRYQYKLISLHIGDDFHRLYTFVDQIMEMIIHALCVYVCAQLYLTDSATPWTIACQASLFLEFYRQEHWSELPFPTPGDLPKPRTEPISPVSSALAGGFTTSTIWEAQYMH